MRMKRPESGYRHGGQTRNVGRSAHGMVHRRRILVGQTGIAAGTAAIYLIAFIVAARQFRGLLGERGLLPIPRFLAANSFRSAPSLFQFHYSDRFFACVCIAGAVFSAALLAGFGDLVPLWAAMPTWLLVWVLYLSIVNVGQTWYSFGWESLLLEAGFLVMFLGNDDVGPPLLVLLLARWLLFRVEFGAGLINCAATRAGATSPACTTTTRHSPCLAR